MCEKKLTNRTHYCVVLLGACRDAIAGAGACDYKGIALYVSYSIMCVTLCCCAPSHPLLADITRLERWERAAKYGKSPPQQIRELILKHPNNKDVSER